MASPITQAMREICDEKGITYESVLETVEAALAAAYRKDYGERNQNIKAEFDPETAGVRAFDEKEVMPDEFVDDALKEIEERQRQREIEEEMRARGDIPPGSAASVAPPEADGEDEDGQVKYNPKLHIALTAAKEYKEDAQVGDTIRIPLEVPGTFGRMAAQTAKQVITQRLREAERDTIFNEWKGREGQVVVGMVQRKEGRTVLLDLGPRATGMLREEEQIPTDRCAPGTRLQVLLYAVGRTMRGPELLCSRTHPDLLRHLFSVEVPEVSSGAVEVVAIAREPGSRAKVAVRATEENVDPIGACIGQRGTRVQTIIAELSGEKIDIIQHDDDVAAFVANSMAPAKVVNVELNEKTHTAVVRVPQEQFSLAIGRSGQNVRLAARLTGWKINVQEAIGDSTGAEAVASPDGEEVEGDVPATEEDASEVVIEATPIVEEAADEEVPDEAGEADEDIVEEAPEIEEPSSNEKQEEKE
ncbi:MAG: transcription termination factor NusA [Candidatus Uhrbacteria bacterium]